MSKIRLSLPDSAIVTAGTQITFKAPCGCADAEVIIIGEDSYALVNTRGEEVSGKNTFVSGSIVSVLLDPDTLRAYVLDSSQADIVELKAADKTNADNLTAHKTAYNAKVTELAASDKANADALAEHKTVYNAKVTQLEQADSKLSSDLDAHKTAYAQKVTALEAADKTNADNLATLLTAYNAKVAALEAKDNEIAGALNTHKSAYDAKVVSLEAADAANASNLSAHIGNYNKKVSELETADSDNAKALSDHKSAYTNKIAALEAADKTNSDSIATHTSDIKSLSSKYTTLSGKVNNNSNKVSSALFAYTPNRLTNVTVPNRGYYYLALVGGADSYDTQSYAVGVVFWPGPGHSVYGYVPMPTTSIYYLQWIINSDGEIKVFEYDNGKHYDITENYKVYAVQLSS